MAAQGAVGSSRRFSGRGPGGAAGADIDPATGLPIAPAAGAAASGRRSADIGSTIVHIPSLTDVRLADVLDAIQLVADPRSNTPFRILRWCFPPKALKLRSFSCAPSGWTRTRFTPVWKASAPSPLLRFKTRQQRRRWRWRWRRRQRPKQTGLRFRRRQCFRRTRRLS